MFMVTAGLAWASTSTPLSDRFAGWLKQIANQDNDIIMNTTGWGDKTYRWDRL
jgi:hypothetical protein